jgi:hypothetical protein
MRRMLFLALLAAMVPTSTFAFSDKEKSDIAERLSKTYKTITVSLVSQPVIVGDMDPVIYRVSPAGKPNFGNLFRIRRYDIIHKPDTTDVLGSYLCTIADEFVREQRAGRADYLRGISLTVGVSRPADFEFSTDRDTLHDMIYAALTLWDFLRNDYGKFNIFVRGYADRGGAAFQEPLLPQYPYHDLTYLPLATPGDPMLAAYLRTPASKKIGAKYTNADLPDLRATFLKNVIDVFLRDCNLNGHLTPQAVVLDGAVIDETKPDYRTIDLYFYAYR